MKARAQILVIAAILLSVGMLFLAVAVDGGRLFLEQARLERAAQAAADAGIGVAAEQVVILAAARQTEAAQAPPCSACTPTPPPSPAEAWLTDSDREALISSAMQVDVARQAMLYAERNGLAREATTVEYPFDYQPQDAAVRIRVETGRRVEILLAGLLNPDWAQLDAAAISQVPQR